jgi:hypothetical protein
MSMLSTLLGQTEAGADPLKWWDVLRHDVIPVASAYLVFIGVLIAYARARSRPGRPRSADHRPPATWLDLVRYLAITAAGGYLFFLGIVVGFYVVLGGESPEFLRQALAEGSLLAFAMVIPAFLVLSRLQELLSGRGRRNEKSGSGRYSSGGWTSNGP